jgi:hypothetical protein
LTSAVPGVGRFAQAANEHNVRIADFPDVNMLREVGMAGSGEPTVMAERRQKAEAV